MAASVVTGVAWTFTIITGVTARVSGRAVQPTKTIDQRGVRKALDLRASHLQLAHLRSGNIPKTILYI
jgi:hypothetical protein